VEVRHLRAFVAVAEELHFGRAARRLQLTPAPVSRSVLELERELGVQLFARRHHDVQLTDHGRTLLLGATELLESWGAFVEQGRAAAARGRSRPIRLGCPSLAPSVVVDQVLAALAEARPGTPVDTEFAASVHLLDALRAGDLDLTVALLPVAGPDLCAHVLGRYRFAVVVNPLDELARLESIRPADLSGRRVMTVTWVQPAAAASIVRWLTEAGAVLDVLPEPDLARMAQLVRHGRGITLTGSAGLVPEVFRQQGLVVIPVVEPGPHLELGMVWRTDADQALVAELVARLDEVTGTGRLLV
jgi:DNA-binding transcriptional LysR family regulator